MWKLTIQDDQATKTVVHLVREEYTVGRDESNAVRLTERNISRKHAKLTRTNEEWRLHDIRSYNGCYVNGARVADPQPLMHGDLIQLGDYRLTLEDEAQVVGSDDSVLTVPGRQSMHTQSDRLVLIAGPGQGQEFVLAADRLVVGRGEECEISVNHPSVSRVHAEIRKVAEGRWEVVDLSSANGIRINGVEMPQSLLDSRDVVELGDVILKFLPAGEIYIPGPDEVLRLDQARGNRRLVPLSLKIAIVFALLAAAAVAAVVVLRAKEPPIAPIARSEGKDPVGQTLREATAMLTQGDTEGAMQHARAIPESSNLRASSDFRAIQDAWADSLFDKAGKSQDPSEKRALLDRVASTPSVDPARRKRAADELEAMQKSAVNIADLPSDDEASADAATAAAVPEPSAKKPVPTAAKAATTKKPTAPAPKTTATSGSLVRKNPFGNP